MNTIHFVWHHRALTVVAIATALTSASFAVPVSTLYLLARGLTWTQVFTLETVLVVSIMVCDLPTGRLADLTSDRAVLVAGYQVGAVAAIGFATSHGFGQFVATHVLSGLGIALVSGADRSYLAAVLDREAGNRLTGVLGHCGALSAVSGALAGIIGALLATRGIGWPAAAAAVAETAGAAVVLALPAAPRTRDGDDSPTPEPLGAVARHVLATPVLWLSALQPWILVGAAFYLNQPRWQSTGVDVRWFGVLLALAQTGAAVGSHSSEWLCSRVGSRTRLVAASTFGCAAGFALMTIPHRFGTIAGFVVILASAAVRGPVADTLTTVAAPVTSRATALSMVSTVASLVGAALNPLVGLVTSHSVTAACLTLAGVMVVFALAWARVSDPSTSGAVAC